MVRKRALENTATSGYDSDVQEHQDQPFIRCNANARLRGRPSIPSPPARIGGCRVRSHRRTVPRADVRHHRDGDRLFRRAGAGDRRRRCLPADHDRAGAEPGIRRGQVQAGGVRHRRSGRSCRSDRPANPPPAAARSGTSHRTAPKRRLVVARRRRSRRQRHGRCYPGAAALPV